MRKYLDLRTNIALGLIIAFAANISGPFPNAQAQDISLPAPGVMVALSPEFNPPMLKGIKIHPDDPLHFDFILDRGDSRLSNDALKDESARLIKYFLASLTVPEKDLWVNLSPYEKNRIVPESFGRTKMGRDLLAEDYMLKQITASLIYPESRTGKEFWKKVYEQAAQRYGTTNIPVNTFNKVWIVPEKAVVYENTKAGTAYVVESKLKVMLEQDYLSMQKHGYVQDRNINALGCQIIREIVIPELNKEVNEGENFARLRQVYNSLILAAWYKKKIKDSILAQVYANKNKVAGIMPLGKSATTEAIYQQYLQAFRKGVYNYIKEETDPLTQEVSPKKYFSGGFSAAHLFGSGVDSALSINSNPAMLSSIRKKGLILVMTSFALFTNPISALDRPPVSTVRPNDLSAFFSGVWSDYMTALAHNDKDADILGRELVYQAKQYSPVLARMTQQLTDSADEFSVSGINAFTARWTAFNTGYLVPHGYYGELDLMRNSIYGRNIYNSVIYKVERSEEHLVDKNEVLTLYGRKIDRFNTIGLTAAQSMDGQRIIFINLNAEDAEVNKIMWTLAGRPYSLVTFGEKIDIPLLTDMIREVYSGMDREQVREYLENILRKYEFTHQAQDMLMVNYKGGDNFGVSGFVWDLTPPGTKKAIDAETVAMLSQFIAAPNTGSALAIMFSFALEGQPAPSPFYAGARWILNKLDGRPIGHWTDWTDAKGLTDQVERLRRMDPDLLRAKAGELIRDNWSERLLQTIINADSAMASEERLINDADIKTDTLVERRSDGSTATIAAAAQLRDPVFKNKLVPGVVLVGVALPKGTQSLTYDQLKEDYRLSPKNKSPEEGKAPDRPWLGELWDQLQKIHALKDPKARPRPFPAKRQNFNIVKLVQYLKLTPGQRENLLKYMTDHIPQKEGKLEWKDYLALKRMINGLMEQDLGAEIKMHASTISFMERGRFITAENTNRILNNGIFKDDLFAQGFRSGGIYTPGGWKTADSAMNTPPAPQEFTHAQAIKYFESIMVNPKITDANAGGLIRMNVNTGHVVMSLADSNEVSHNELIRAAHQKGGYATGNYENGSYESEWISMVLGWDENNKLSFVDLSPPIMRNPNGEYSPRMLQFLGLQRKSVPFDFKNTQYRQDLRKELILIYRSIQEAALKSGIDPKEIETFVPTKSMGDFKNSKTSLDKLAGLKIDGDTNSEVNGTKNKDLIRAIINNWFNTAPARGRVIPQNEWLAVLRLAQEPVLLYTGTFDAPQALCLSLIGKETDIPVNFGRMSAVPEDEIKIENALDGFLDKKILFRALTESSGQKPGSGRLLWKELVRRYGQAYVLIALEAYKGNRGKAGMKDWGIIMTDLGYQKIGSSNLYFRKPGPLDSAMVVSSDKSLETLMASLYRQIISRHVVHGIPFDENGIPELTYLKNGNSRVAYLYGRYDDLVLKFAFPSEHADPIDVNETAFMAKIAQRSGYTFRSVDGITLIDIPDLAPFMYVGVRSMNMVQQKAVPLNDSDPRAPEILRGLAVSLASRGIHWIPQAKNVGFIDGKPVVLDFGDLALDQAMLSFSKKPNTGPHFTSGELTVILESIARTLQKDLSKMGHKVDMDLEHVVRNKEGLLYPDGVNVALLPGSVPGLEAALFFASKNKIKGTNFLIVPPFESLEFGQGQPNGLTRLYTRSAVYINKDGKITMAQFDEPLEIDAMSHGGLGAVNQRILYDKGVPLLNSPGAVEMAERKDVFSAFLREKGLPAPQETVVKQDLPEDQVKDTVINFLNRHWPSQIVVKPSRGSLGEGVRMFTFYQQKEILDHVLSLQKNGAVIIQERIEPVKWTDQAGRPLDWNFRVLSTWDGNDIVITKDMIEVRYQPRSNKPVSMAAGASAATLEEFFKMKGLDSDKSDIIFQQVKNLITKAVREMEARLRSTEKAGSRSTGLLGWDLILSKYGKLYILEANAASVGGIPTMENLLDEGRKGDTLLPVMLYLSRIAVEHNRISPAVSKDRIEGYLEVPKEFYVLNNAAIDLLGEAPSITEKILRFALDSLITDKDIFINLSVALARQGKYTQAEEVLKEAVKKYHYVSENIFLNLSSVLIKQGKYPEAEKLLRDAIQEHNFSNERLFKGIDENLQSALAYQMKPPLAISRNADGRYEISDKAMAERDGGIDLDPAHMDLRLKNAGEGIKFHMDRSMLEKLQNAPGLTPVIINIEPMTDLKAFLGLSS